MAAAGLGAPRGGDEEVTEAGDRNDPVDVMKVLVDKGADVNAANDAGMTALHYAVQRGSDRIIEYLAGQGAQVRRRRTSRAARPPDLARGRTAALVSQLSRRSTQHRPARPPVAGRPSPDESQQRVRFGRGAATSSNTFSTPGAWRAPARRGRSTDRTDRRRAAARPRRPCSSAAKRLIERDRTATRRASPRR